MHVPLVIVQRSVALVPTGTPVTPLVANVLVVMVAVPAVTVQRPVPIPGTLPASVKLAVLHCVMSVPAAAVVGRASLVNTTSSALVQLPLVIVQRSVALLPAARPVTPLIADAGVVIDTAPLTILHNPVPKPGTLPARVNELVLHNV